MEALLYVKKDGYIENSIYKLVMKQKYLKHGPTFLLL